MHDEKVMVLLLQYYRIYLLPPSSAYFPNKFIYFVRVYVRYNAPDSSSTIFISKCQYMPAAPTEE
jgi:hypothetical protein